MSEAEDLAGFDIERERDKVQRPLVDGQLLTDRQSGVEISEVGSYIALAAVIRIRILRMCTVTEDPTVELHSAINGLDTGHGFVVCKGNTLC